MEQREYYDWNSGRFFCGRDGCTLSDWMENPDHASSFAVHPDGFAVFLRPSEIRVLDEYSEGDPYTVAGNLDKPFHKQRIDLTVDLLTRAVGRETRCPRILDVACGEGHITAAIHQAFPTTEIHAFDGSLSAISSAHRAHQGITFAVANAYDPPYAPDYFDCVICNNIWEHVPDPLYMLDKVTRSLKPNGYLIVSTPNRYRLSNLLRVFFGKPVSLMSPHHVTEYSIGQVLEQLRYAGFDVERISGNLLRPNALTFRLIIENGVGRLIAGLLRITGSHHVLATTLFYMAKKHR